MIDDLKVGRVSLQVKADQRLVGAGVLGDIVEGFLYDTVQAQGGRLGKLTVAEDLQLDVQAVLDLALLDQLG